MTIKITLTVEPDEQIPYEWIEHAIGRWSAVTKYRNEVTCKEVHLPPHFTKK